MEPTQLRAGGEVLPGVRLGRGPRLVLLHGGPGLDHHVLLPLAERLAEAHEVWLPDLPGHGEAAGPSPSLRELVDRLARFLAEGDAIVGGHSLGALLVHRLIARGVPLRAALLIAPPGPGERRRRLPAAHAEDPDEVRREILAQVRDETGEPACDAFTEALGLAHVRASADHPRLRREILASLERPPAPCRAAHPVLVLAGGLDRLSPPASVAAPPPPARRDRWWRGGPPLSG